MTTKNLLLIGAVAALIIVAGVLIKKSAVAQPQNGSTTSTLATKSGTRETIALNEQATESRSQGKVLPSEARDNGSRKLDSIKPALEGAHAATDKVTLKIDIPKPNYTGTPKPIRSPNLEPDLAGKEREPIQVPVGTKLISKGCKVTSSDPEPIIGELAFVTDGEKEHDAGTYVELGPNTQWVQIDIGKEKQLFAACIWHYHGEARVYRDVVCQVSNDPDLIDGVQTVFNNDHDNSSKLGAGKDKEYVEDNKGRPFAISGIKGRYIRFYSRGNTSNEMNHYTEVEVYGKDLP